MNRWSALLSLPALFVIGALLFFTLQKLEHARPLPEAETEAQPRYELENAEWMRMDASGAPQFIAKAERISWYDDQSARMLQPELFSLGGKGSPWRLAAPTGRMPADSRDIFLSGSVLATGKWPDGADLTLNTDRLWVDTENKMLHTDAELSLDGPGRHVLATGMNADWTGRDLKLLSNIQARYEPHKESVDAPGT